MNYWFTSDTHFGHSNIIKYCNRPFKTIAEMDEAMITNWNELVKPDDMVWHLGDFAWLKNPEEGNKLLAKLNGAITLIRGNHDSSRIVKKMKFQAIHELISWRVPPGRIRLLTMCHYPMMMWRSSHHMEWHLHGHCHGTLPSHPTRLCFDIGVDSFDFKPVHLDEVIRIFKKREKHWRALVMKHDRPHGAGPEWKLFALIDILDEGKLTWAEDCGYHWNCHGLIANKRPEDDVRCWVWAQDYADIPNRLPNGEREMMGPAEAVEYEDV